MIVLIEGELVQLDQVVHAYAKKEHNKEQPFHIYLHFGSGARTSFRYDQEEDANELLLFIIKNYPGQKVVDRYDKGGRGKDSRSIPSDVVINT